MKFYFTYGTSKSFPFVGGWTEVIADSWDEACEKFSNIHPLTPEGFINCAGIYMEGLFKITGMEVEGNINAFCQEVIA